MLSSFLFYPLLLLAHPSELIASTPSTFIVRANHSVTFHSGPMLQRGGMSHAAGGVASMRTRGGDLYQGRGMTKKKKDRRYRQN